MKPKNAPTAKEKTKKPERLKRKDSFLGIHFDFHAGYDCTEIGKNVTRRMIERIIDQVHPDYIQCDCKGHPGISSYPTKIGYPAPGFIRDQLKIWREVTAERSVALYMHYSGVRDEEAVKQHPDWACIDENGAVDTRKTSVFGPYPDELLIPQLKELADVYAVDGVWVDGECWAVERDYSPQAIALFREKTGINAIPKTAGEPHYFAFTEFNRDGFRAYLNRYVTELHRHKAGFQICSNWAFSSHMPEPVTVDIDCISGDFDPRNSINSGRFEGRCMVHQGKPWDLMSWSFTNDPGKFSTKSIPQLKQEAAVVISLGGGYQVYFLQNRDGSVRQWEWDKNIMGEVAKFCRERQIICHHARPVPQVGLLLSSYAFYRGNKKVFSGWHGEYNALKGTLQSLLDSQNSVEIVMEHHLAGRMHEYPLIVIPEWEHLSDGFRKELLAYVENGGNLLVIGPKTAALFENELGVKLAGTPEVKINGLEYKGRLAGINTVSQKVELGSDVKSFGRVYSDAKNRNEIAGPSHPAASIRTFGKGKIATTYLNLGERYLNGRTALARDFLNGLVRELFPDPIVTVEGSHCVDVVVNRIGKKLAVNLVNTSGDHENEKVLVIDEIPSVGPVTVSIQAGEKPRRVTLEPGGRNIAYEYTSGKITVTLPRLEIHALIVVE